MSNRIVSQNAKNELLRKPQMIEQTRRSLAQPSKFEPSRHVEGGKRKMVRFKQCEESNVDKNGRRESKGGAVRIRVVVTKEELKQILNYGKDSKYPSVENLVSAMRLRDRRIHDVGTIDGGINSSWKPDLESIPEDH